jgi:hypothetical protein
MPNEKVDLPAALAREGWTWLFNSRKWHYFRGSRSLCGKFLLLGSKDLEMGNDKSADNCGSCQRKLEAKRDKRSD